MASTAAYIQAAMPLKRTEIHVIRRKGEEQQSVRGDEALCGAACPRQTFGFLTAVHRYPNFSGETP